MVHNPYFLIYSVIPLCHIFLENFVWTISQKVLKVLQWNFIQKKNQKILSGPYLIKSWRYCNETSYTYTRHWGKVQCTWFITITSYFAELFHFVKKTQKKHFVLSISEQVLKVLLWNFIHLYKALRRSAVHMLHNSYFLIYRVTPLCKKINPKILSGPYLNKSWRYCYETSFYDRGHWRIVQCTWFITLSSSLTE